MCRSFYPYQCFDVGGCYPEGCKQGGTSKHNEATVTVRRHTSRHTRRGKQLTKEADQRRGSAHQRGYTAEWRKFRNAFLKSYRTCLYCRTRGHIKNSDLVDHITPHRGDPAKFWPPGIAKFKFAGCCTDCHNGPKKDAEHRCGRTGENIVLYLIRIGMLPPDWPID